MEENVPQVLPREDDRDEELPESPVPDPEDKDRGRPDEDPQAD